MRKVRLLLPLLAGLLAACGFRPEDAAGGGGASPKKPADEVARVRVAPVARGEIASFLETTATIESEAMVDLYPRASGILRAIEVEEGDRLEKDALLARIDDEEAALNERNAHVAYDEAVHREEQVALAFEESVQREAQARRSAEQAKRDWERTEAMAAPEGSGRPIVVSPKDLEAAKLAWDKAEGERALAEFGVKKATVDKTSAKVSTEKAKIAWDIQKHRLEETRITSPIAGVVANRFVKVGETVSPPTKAFTVVDATRLRVTVHRPQRELGFVRPDLPLVARAEALPGREFTGRVLRVSPTVEPGSGNFRLTAEIEGGESGLRPGMLVRLKITTDRKADAVLVPKKSVVYEGAQPVVFAVRDGKAVRVPVEEGYSDRERMEVRNLGEGGLRADDRVVVAGASDLRDGAAVEVVEG